MSGIHRLRQTVARLEEAAAASAVTEDEDERVVADLSTGSLVTNDEWLGAVVLCIADELRDVETALNVVDANRRPCLIARDRGVEPWEVAEFILLRSGLRRGEDVNPVGPDSAEEQGSRDDL